MQLEKVLKQSIIKKIDILYDAVSNGIMDYLVGGEEENKDNYQNISIVSDGENGLVMRGPISERKDTRD